MGSDWEEFLFEHAPLQILDGDRGKNYPKRTEFKQSGHCIFLNTGNVTKDGFNLTSLDCISKERDELLRKGKLQREDVVLTTRGTVGNVAYFNGNVPYEHIRINSGMVILRPDLPSLYPQFLYSFVRSLLFKAQVEALSTGSAQPQLPIRDIKRINISLPPLPVQKAIAHVLGTLDDRIELNRRMNETLEAMAQALFKSWFVDFDPVIDNALAGGKEIPAELNEKAQARVVLGDKRRPLPEEIRTLFPEEFTFSDELGWIPKGWEVGVVDNILDRLTVKKRYKKNDVADYGLTPVYEQGANILLGYHDGVPEIETSAESPAFIFGDHTCVTKLSCESFSISANVIPLKGKGYPAFWVYFAIQDKQSFEEYRRHWMELIIKPVILPALEIAKKFDILVKTWGLRQMELSHHSSTLIKLRDTLLPKLLSGEVRIPDAEKMMEAGI